MIRIVAVYQSPPPAKVWKALTVPELLAKWWAAGDVKPVVGHRFTLDMGQWGQQPCEVIAVESRSDSLGAIAAKPGTLDSTISVAALEAEGARALVSGHLEHAGFDLDSLLGKKAFEGMGGGWPSVLKRIAQALDTPVVA